MFLNYSITVHLIIYLCDIFLKTFSYTIYGDYSQVFSEPLTRSKSYYWKCRVNKTHRKSLEIKNDFPHLLLMILFRRIS